MSWPKAGSLLWATTVLEESLYSAPDPNPKRDYTGSDESVLVFPSCRLVYVLNSADKKLILQNPDLLLSDENACLIHARTKEVFGSMGYVTSEFHNA